MAASSNVTNSAFVHAGGKERGHAARQPWVIGGQRGEHDSHPHEHGRLILLQPDQPGLAGHLPWNAYRLSLALPRSVRELSARAA
jgi:hypothetical protein